jgi:hypothetical protein
VAAKVCEAIIALAQHPSIQTVKYKITLLDERLDVTEFVRQRRLMRGPEPV